jgi:hypothetical protein
MQGTDADTTTDSELSDVLRRQDDGKQAVMFGGGVRSECLPGWMRARRVLADEVDGN